MLPNKQIDSKL